MSEIPLAYSDIQCGECFEYFRLDGDLIDHRAQVHGSIEPAPTARCGRTDSHARHVFTEDGWVHTGCDGVPKPQPSER